MAERVFGVVGREVVVVETTRRAPADGAGTARLRAASRTSPVTSVCVSVTNACSAAMSGECHMPS